MSTIVIKVNPMRCSACNASTIPRDRANTAKVLVRLAVFAFVLHVSMTFTSAAAMRGRVQILSGTVVCDDSKLLRGTSFWIDASTANSIKDDHANWRNYFQSLSRIYHLNLIRICIYDRYQDIAPLSRASAVDTVVNWCEQDGIYAIVNWHNDYNGGNEVINMTQANAIWDFFAPRYKDRTHVFYESSNETKVEGAKQQSIYSRIRGHAPTTLIVCWTASSAGLLTLSTLQSTTGIDYKNAAVGYHSYGGTNDHDKAIVWRNAGYPVMCTEVPSMDASSWGSTSYPVMMPHIKELESNGISWVNWMSACYTLYGGDTRWYPEFITQLRNYDISFWPASYSSEATLTIRTISSSPHTATVAVKDVPPALFSIAGRKVAPWSVGRVPAAMMLIGRKEPADRWNTWAQSR